MKMIKFKWFFFAGLLLFTQVLLFALDPGKQFTQYIHKKWTTDDDLPSNYISCMLQTRDGYLWIGTDEGLARFDGVKFEIFNKENTPGIPDNRITALLESSEPTLWIASRGGLTALKNREFRTWNRTSGLLHNVVHALQEDGQGNIRVGYQGAGISVFKKGDFLSLSHPAALAHTPAINIICQDKRHPKNLWVGTDSGLFLLTAGKLREFPVKMKNGGPLGAVRSLVCDEEGDLWAGTDKSGLIHIKYRSGSSQPSIYTFNKQSGLESNWVNAVFKDNDKNLWVGTEGGGLHRLFAGRISVFSGKDGLSNDSVNCLLEDREGNLWVGTYSGLNLLMNGKFTGYTESEGLLDNVTWTVYEDRQKKLWITTNKGLNCFRNGRFFAYTKNDGLSSDFVSCTWGDNQGNLWVGTYDRGLNLLAQGEFITIGKEQGLDAHSIRAVYVDSRGNTWVGSYGSGLFKKPTGQDIFISISSKNGLSSDYIFAICEDRQGGLWIGTDGGGLNCLKDEHISRYTKANGLSSNSILAILEDTDRKGTLWLGSEDSGLNYFKEGNIIPVTLKAGLKDNTIYQVIEDDNGFLWMGGNRGVSRVRKQELYDFVEGKIARVTTTLFGKADGIKGGQCSGSFQPAGWKTSAGKIWFPTSKGVVCVDPDHIEINVTAPPVHIEKVLLNGRPAPRVDYLTLEPEINKIEVHYTALSLSEPRNVKFKYIMEGFETEWVTPEKRKDRIAVYTNLSPGNYTFRLTACNNDGIWNKEGVFLELSVLYPFWRQWWFILLCLVGFSLLSYFTLSSLKKWFKLVEFWRKKNYIGQYRIIEQIGSGGMANIFKVDRGKGSQKKILALKLMKEEFMLDEVYRKRFLEEGRLIDNLDHPHIVKVVERGEHDNNLFIVMELLEGQTLDGAMQQGGGFSLREGLDIIRQILEALSTIHKAGIIHRDLKPGNIMLVSKGDQERVVKILDFGLARAQSISRVTESGMVVGTLSYLAPEQLLNSEYSAASDIYALGVIIYEMLTGRRPYRGETPLEIMRQVFKTDIIEPKVLKKDIPPQLNSLILSMLDKEPGNRPSAEVLAITLRKLNDLLSN